MSEIIFTSKIYVEEKYFPVPASQFIPDWYRSTTIRDRDNSDILTIKKCIPILDSIISGYIIFTHKDISVSSGETFSWERIDKCPVIPPVEKFHKSQNPKYPIESRAGCPKFNIPWSIKTEKGYSTLFIPPMHRCSEVFEILPAIVDTDNYINPVNLPFVFKNKDFSGTIKAGTPIAQILPFKRDSFTMKIFNKKNLKDVHLNEVKLKSMEENSYRSQFWEKKHYR